MQYFIAPVRFTAGLLANKLFFHEHKFVSCIKNEKNDSIDTKANLSRLQNTKVEILTATSFSSYGIPVAINSASWFFAFLFVLL